MSTKIVELFIEDMDDEGGIEAISLVSRPAHEQNWQAFNEEVETYSPYKVLPDDFCASNPTIMELGEPYSKLIDEGWEILRVERMTPLEVQKMNEAKFTRSSPNEESGLDAQNFRVRYKYIGPNDDRTRNFCKEMLVANKVYTIEDIDALSDGIANEQFGFYEIFTWRGSYNCRHQWVRLIYKKAGSIINNADSSKNLIDEQGVGPLLNPDTRTTDTIAAANRGTRADGQPINQWRPGVPRQGSSFAEFPEFAEVGPKGGIKPSKKAPKSNTPNPNPKGEGTAKGDASSSRGAEVPEAIKETLSKKAKEFNERYKEKLGYGVDLGQLKSVYQRGVGAYNASHSPKVQSQQQWALARVNAFLYLVRNGRPQNPKYTGDYDLLPKNHPKKQKMSFGDPCWEGYEQVGMKLVDGREVPNCVPEKEAMRREREEFRTYDDYPESAKNNACKALRWRDKHGDEVEGMTRVGWVRANQLCKGENISEETIARMSAFQRHKKNSEVAPEYKETPWKDAGYVAWMGWGGTSGVEWASRKLESIRNGKMSQQKLMFFDEDKRILVGAAMVPNRMIHRYDDLGNLYYVFFSKETIKKMADKFLRQKRTDETSIEHDGKKLGADKVYITESWVSEDPIKDKSSSYGFELPAGTWYVSMKVEDPTIWKQIKNRTLNGFSVEGLFAEKSYFSSEVEIINNIKEILKSIQDE